MGGQLIVQSEIGIDTARAREDDEFEFQRGLECFERLYYEYEKLEKNFEA